MASKNSNINMLVKNKKAIFKFGCAVHDELLGASHLIIDETVNTVTKSQKIAAKIIKNGEPLVTKQVEITVETIAAIKNQATKSGKRALKLLGLTKEFNSLTKTISKKVDAIPSPEDVIDNAKEYVANAKSDVEKTITKATDSIKKVTATAEKTIVSKTAKLSKTASPTAKKSKSAKKVASTRKSAVKAIKPTAKKSIKSTAKKITVKPATKKMIAKKVTSSTKTAAKAAPKKEVMARTTTDLINIKGIGPSLAGIMTANGIKNIAQLKEATPDVLKMVTSKAGNRYASFDTNLWIEAAKASK